MTDGPRYVQKIVTERSFDAVGALIQAGHIGTFDANKLNGKEPHLFDPGDYQPVMVAQSALGPTGPNPTVPQQIPPDAVQGPGGAYVKPGGAILVSEVVLDADQRLAGRLQEGDTSEGDLLEQLREYEAKAAAIRAKLEGERQERETLHRVELANIGVAGGAPGASPVPAAPGVPPAAAPAASDADKLIEGNVPTVTADLGAKTDDQLVAMQTAEKDREQPRKGVLSAIEAELDKRKEAAQS